MNVQLRSSNLFTGINSIFQNQGLKSSQEKMQRKAECDNKVAFFENQKSNLKNMKCDSLEEISRKLDLFHSYEDQIAAAKEEYNQSQMFHAMDEAKELGEKIAKEAEKAAPKTPEERQKELVEEALGTDENKGMMSECMEELAELSEELTEEVCEDISQDLSQEDEIENLSEALAQKVADYSFENYRKVDIRI